MESVLIRFIKENSDWEEKLKKKKIQVKRAGNLAIFNYMPGCDFTDPVVQEARGIIIDTDQLKVVCWPFRKFCNYQEEAADDIDWASARIEDKIDGSIVKLWYREEIREWVWSTNSAINAAEASWSSGNFLDLIRRAVNYQLLDLSRLNKDCTYIFELVSPYTRVVILYPETRLYHIGTRNNKTGEEYECSIGIPQPEKYPVGSLSECVEASRKLNAGDTDVKKEGFVVVDKNWHRIKIKTPEYLEMHHMVNNHNYSRNSLVRFILNSQAEEIEKVITAFPDAEVYIRWYQYQLAKFKSRAKAMGQKASVLYEEFDQDRKAVAKEIKNDEYAYFGFKAISGQTDVNELIPNMPIAQILRFVEEYKEEEK